MFNKSHTVTGLMMSLLESYFCKQVFSNLAILALDHKLYCWNRGVECKEEGTVNREFLYHTVRIERGFWIIRDGANV